MLRIHTRPLCSITRAASSLIHTFQLIQLLSIVCCWMCTRALVPHRCPWGVWCSVSLCSWSHWWRWLSSGLGSGGASPDTGSHWSGPGARSAPRWSPRLAPLPRPPGSPTAECKDRVTHTCTLNKKCALLRQFGVLIFFFLWPNFIHQSAEMMIHYFDYIIKG